VRAGVASLKIEGRLKSPEYVANITRLYREALEELQRGRNGAQENSAPGPRNDASEQRRYEMEMAFSRGLYTGWLRGTNNQQLVHARFGKKRGVFLGVVTAVRRDAVLVRTEGPMKAGDGVVFDAGHPEDPEEGGRIYEVRQAAEPGMVELRFGRGHIDFSRVRRGDKLWKTDDPELNRRLRQTFETDKPRFRRPIDIEVHGAEGKPLTVIARDEFGNIASADSRVPLASARTQPLTTERLREQLGRLGDTAFELRGLRNELPDALILPVSELNRLRREVARELERLRRTPPRWTLIPEAQSSHSTVHAQSASAAGEPRLIVLVRTLPQLEAALRCGARTIYCDFENPKRYREAVALFHTARGCETAHSDAAIFVAPPRISKMGEEWMLKQVQSSNADGYLVRNYDHLKFFAGQRCIGDFSLNIANHLSADYFRNRFGLDRVTASYDLNFQQLESLLKAAPAEWFEITIHQHMPMFHMEHCVFCAFLSEGTDYTNCGRPCDRHDLKLRDRVGAEHPVKADAGCRNTVFHSMAQTGAEYVERMIALGARHFRIEFVNETPEQVTRTIAKYHQLLRGEISGAQLWRELKLLNQLGVTRGTIRD